MTTETQTLLYSNRIQSVPRSFIRDILKVAGADDIISFAGGLPNKKYFPIQELNYCTQIVFEKYGQQALQYSSTEGLLALREQIAQYYCAQGLDVKAKQILITTGSQQALDLIGKVFINENEGIVIEEPAYLGAIQAFSMYKPNFLPTTLEDDGISIEKLSYNVKFNNPKLAYLVTNFQNPTGISYSEEKRKAVAEIAIRNNLLLIEDNPYGQIKFENKSYSSLYKYAPNNTILLGTFSKSIAPGFRIGWMVIPDEHMYRKIEVAKQASDLHTNIFSQYVISTFLNEYGTGAHLEKIIQAYSRQANAMISAIKENLPAARVTIPEGGMFCWVEMFDSTSSMELFNEAIKNKVAFVPGVPFYINRDDSNTFRLNFSCLEPLEIKTGIEKLADSLNNIR